MKKGQQWPYRYNYLKNYMDDIFNINKIEKSLFE